MSMLDDAVQITKEIGSEIEHEHWDAVVRLTEKRQEILEGYFRSPPPEDSQKSIEERINFILASDKRHKKLIESQKNDYVSSTLDLKKKFNVAQAYAKNQ